MQQLAPHASAQCPSFISHLASLLHCAEQNVLGPGCLRSCIRKWPPCGLVSRAAPTTVQCSTLDRQTANASSQTLSHGGPSSMSVPFASSLSALERSNQRAGQPGKPGGANGRWTGDTTTTPISAALWKNVVPQDLRDIRPNQSDAFGEALMATRIVEKSRNCCLGCRPQLLG